MPRTRDSLSSLEKYRSFRAAFEMVSAHRAKGDFLAAYVIAFSIFEDRLNAAVMTSADMLGIARPRGHLPLHKRVNRLVAEGRLVADMASDFKNAGDERNALIHAAMWQLEVFTEEHVTQAIARARRIDSIAVRLRRELATAARTA